MEVENLVYLTTIFLVVMVILIHSCMLRSTIIRILTNLKPTITIKTSPPSHSQYRCRKKLLKRKASGDALIDDRHTIHNPELYFSNPCQRCGKCNAKTNCSHQCCSTCCHIKREPCDGHKTGYSHALSLIETAHNHLFNALDLSYAYLRHCPPNITVVGCQLASLNLSNNKIQYLPSNIGSLVNLKELFIQYNRLTYIPESLCNLSKLEELDIKNNSLFNLPDQIGRMRSIVILNVTNNKLSKLPRSIGLLKKLEEFTAQNNLLEHLPDEICAVKGLKVMYLAENKLNTLPFDFGKLEMLLELDVSTCEIDILPESLSFCKSLEKLWLSNNRLSCMPRNIGSLQNLKVLHLRHNHIKYFPASLAELRLSTFTAQHNQLLDETSALLMCQQSVPKVPTLLEWAAVVVYTEKIRVCKGHLPESLISLLNSRQFCTVCSRPLFMFYKCSIKFETIGVCFRLPLCTILCYKCQKTVDI